MIAATMKNDAGKTVLLYIVEPENVARMLDGNPIAKDLGEFIPELPEPVELVIAYTPDAQWVAEQIALGVHVATAVERSKERKPVWRRGSEDLVKAQR